MLTVVDIFWEEIIYAKCSQRFKILSDKYYCIIVHFFAFKIFCKLPLEKAGKVTDYPHSNRTGDDTSFF